MKNQSITTIEQLVNEYQTIGDFIRSQWPMPDKNSAIFARTMKLIEELGELSDEILSSMNLQRGSKLAKHTREDLENEFADVFASLLLMSIELDIDIQKVMERKIKYTKQRFKLT